ncbi:hypothetical protein [Alkalimarinus coralli]|uniref:hypothetical protein n=1 Tax=Alkalimarinus coralli TaxID=2935863 RepID=UPI00202AE286|nr:hypothetical protein [Alkalimarinus coralli]
MLRQRLITILQTLVLLPLLALATPFVTAEIVSSPEVTQFEQINTQAAGLFVSGSAEHREEMSMSRTDMNDHCPDYNSSHQCGSCAACAVLPVYAEKMSVTDSGAATPYQFQFPLSNIKNHFKPPRV